MTHTQPSIFLSHGGGPLPLMNDPGHASLLEAFEKIKGNLEKPDAIIIVSAHWEEDSFRVLSNPKSELLFDYHGFPEEAYKYNYPAPSDEALAESIVSDLKSLDERSDMATSRGYDHGVFVPLLLLFPDADIPVVNVSLKRNLAPEDHIKLGETLRKYREQNILVIGSGMSFHNLRLFGKGSEQSDQFHEWLDGTLEADISEQERRARLVDWEAAPAARAVHPREEHLIPLYVTYGAAGKAVDETLKCEMAGIGVSFYIWN